MRFTMVKRPKQMSLCPKLSNLDEVIVYEWKILNSHICYLENITGTKVSIIFFYHLIMKTGVLLIAPPVPKRVALRCMSAFEMPIQPSVLWSLALIPC